ncbi:MAG: sulfotransferase [Gammaproteobacteria bacterium]|nr:sulfotransferase [Gammaproteobacteria bacterium]
MIFIVGYSRSGTKMMNQVLAKMQIADSVPEVHFFEQIYDFSEPEERRNRNLSKTEAAAISDKLVSIVSRIGSHLDNGKAIADIKSGMASFVRDTRALTKLDIYKQLLAQISSRAAIDPTPRNAYYIEEIAELIPDARFIYMVRDPRDCILSQQRKGAIYWRQEKHRGEAIRLWLNYNPLLMAIFWKNSIENYRKAISGQHADHVLRINYENMIEHPESVAEILHRFTGMGRSSFDVTFIRQDNARKWVDTLQPAEVHLIQLITGPTLEEFGYERIAIPWSARLRSYLLTIYYCAKMPIAFLANWQRMKNPVQVIRRRILGAT